MRFDDTKIIKALFISCLVVVLTAIKAKLEHRFEDLNFVLFFILFLLSFFTLAIFEVAFEKLNESDWFKRVFVKRDYIYGRWLNYAQDRDTLEVYNFALIKIHREGEELIVDGRTFKAFLNTEDQIAIIADGHFVSTIAQYQSTRSLLAFVFTIDDSDKVSMCGHKIFGNAEYHFEGTDKVPLKFLGEFSTSDPPVFCRVIGHRIEETLFKQNYSLVEEYRKCLENAIERKWIDLSQIPKAPMKTVPLKW
jgi:hypothetical protein